MHDGGSEGAASLAVVVCCRDRAALLEEALVAIRASLHPQDDLVVVDSASQDPEVRAVALRAGARLVVCELPGLSIARNAGWRHTDRSLVLFTDDDCRPTSTWRDGAAAAFGDARVGGAWGAVAADRESEVPLSAGETHAEELTRTTVLSSVGHGASMAFRRSALEAIGGFDELLGAGGHFRAGEDKDALWRVFTAGWRVVPAPRMAVSHVVHRDLAAATRVMGGYGLGAGAVARKRVTDVGARRVLFDELWLHGALPALRHVRHGRWAWARALVLRSAGVLRGWRQAGRMKVVDGHLVPLS
jgi:glycosyltransferase involved in cell wall biosynthesis